MKKIFLMALLAFGAVSVSFGISYETCVEMSKSQCIWANGPEYSGNCEK